MKIVAGLGNPGRKYEGTPHSAGFAAADILAAAAGAVWEEKRAFKALAARCEIAGEKVLLVKPQTYMNLSGEAVAPLVGYSNAKPEDLVVIHDDIDLPPGRVRIRKGGSCGGHNGVRNIIERLGTSSFTRVKIGVGKDPSNVIGHVLGKMAPAEREAVEAATERAAKAVEAIFRDGIQKAMNDWNGAAPSAGGAA